MKRSVLLNFFILFLSGCSSLYGQKFFREAYIIKPGGERLNGLAEYNQSGKVPSYCVFKRFPIATEVKYKPGNIKEFGFINGNRYISYNTGKGYIFIESVITGRLSLYRNAKNYYIEKAGSGIIPLDKFPQTLKLGGVEKTYNNISDLLTDLTVGKVKEMPENNRDARGIVTAVAAYNKSTGEAYAVQSKKSAPFPAMSETYHPGSGKNSFGVIGGVNGYKLIIESVKNNLPTGPQATEYAPVGGISYERILSLKDNSVAFRAEILYLQQNFYSYREYGSSTTYLYDDWFFEFKCIRVPLMLKYSFYSHMSFSPFLTGGAIITSIFDRDFYHIRDTSYPNLSPVLIVTTEERNKNIRKSEFSAGLGAGIMIRLPWSMKLNITGRLEAGSGLLIPKMPQDLKKQFSLQHTLMAGLSF